MKIYDKIYLLNNNYINECVKKGSIGYIIEVYNDGAYEVEFSNSITGETIAQLVLNENEIELRSHEQILRER